MYFSYFVFVERNNTHEERSNDVIFVRANLLCVVLFMDDVRNADQWCLRNGKQSFISESFYFKIFINIWQYWSIWVKIFFNMWNPERARLKIRNSALVHSCLMRVGFSNAVGSHWFPCHHYQELLLYRVGYYIGLVTWIGMVIW